MSVISKGTIFQGMFRGICGAIIICFVNFLDCSPPQYEFTVDQLYVRENFSGRNVSNRNICMGPLLTDHGLDTSGILNSTHQFQTITRERPDLQFVPLSKFETTFKKKISSNDLNLLYHQLFKAEMISLQTSDSVWKAVPGDYLMVLRATKALKLKTFDKMIKKELNIEGELWDCTRMEVAWRVKVQGSGLNEKVSDSQFLIEAIKKIYKALPSPRPFYEKGSW